MLNIIKNMLLTRSIFFLLTGPLRSRGRTFIQEKWKKNANAGGPKNCVKKNTKYNPQKKNGTAAQNH